LILALCIISPASAEDTEDYANRLIAKATGQKLYESRQWHALLHYKPSLLYGYKSPIDDPEFFNSPKGKTSPEEELKATIRGFFGTEKQGDEHPRCRFVARYQWLRSILDIDENRLPIQECSEFSTYITRVSPKRAALVLPESYINSPASMFGHTLLRLDSEYESKLLSYAINYAAQTGDETFGPFYAVKGLFGLYKGYFTVFPYYDKLKEYSMIDNRDIWEYELNLSEEEVERMALHVWELKDMYSRYYFFDENCSYNLLFLLEAARPGLDLTSGYLYWVLPVDTVNEVKKHGLIADIKYRPSKATRINHMADMSSKEVQELAIGLAFGEREPGAAVDGPDFSDEEKVRTLDMASEYLQFQYLMRTTEKDVYTKRLLGILSKRSEYGKVEYDIRPPKRPDLGHDSSMIRIGAEYLSEEPSYSLGFRPAYHGLLDPAAAQMRYLPADNELLLDHFMLVEIESFSPVNNFFGPTSWKIILGFERDYLFTGSRDLPFIINPGGGKTYSLTDNIRGYWLAESNVRIVDTDIGKTLVGGGLSLGLIANFTDRIRSWLSVSDTYYFVNESTDVLDIDYGMGIDLSRNNSLSVRLSLVKGLDSEYSSSAGLFYHRYLSL
jgi:hypothetical protein